MDRRVTVPSPHDKPDALSLRVSGSNVDVEISGWEIDGVRFAGNSLMDMIRKAFDVKKDSVGRKFRAKVFIDIRELEDDLKITGLPKPHEDSKNGILDF